MNSSKMRNASLYAVSILVSLLTLGLVGATGAAAAHGASGSVLEVLPSPLASPISPLADDWSLLRSAGVLNAPEPQREFRVAFLGGTGLAGMTAIGQGVWGAAPTLTLPVAPYNNGSDPDTGSTNPTNITFRVIYTDTDGDEPTDEANVYVFRDAGLTDPAPGSPFAMSKTPRGPMSKPAPPTR